MQSTLNSTVPENYNKNDINVLLEYGLVQILKAPSLKKLKLAFDDPDLQITTDLKVIEEKLAKKCYSNVDEFVADLRRMEQNSFEDLLNEKQLLRIFKDFIKYCDFDLKLIKSCAECYWNELKDTTDDWFTESCSTPHSVVMVRLAHSTYIPAKVLDFDEKKVFVRLFKELGVAEIPYGDRIRFYTKLNGQRQKQQRNSAKILQAANLYIENVIKKFGCYNYGDIETTTTPLTRFRLSQHLQYLTSPESRQQVTSEDGKMAKRAKLESHSDSEGDDSDVDVLSMARNVDDVREDIENEFDECMPSVSSNGNSDSHPSLDYNNIEDEVLSSVEDNRRANVSRGLSVSTNETSQSSVRIQRVTSSTMIAVQQSTHNPPILRDCSSRCEFASKEHEISALRKELEQMKSEHQIEVSSMTKSYAEMMKEMRRQNEAEKAEIVQATKTKQWCASCWQEAKLYCCWLTSYCDDFCQRKHWSQHSGKCLNDQSLLERE